MISMEEAQERVSRRLAALLPEGERIGEIPLADGTLSCAGTDVNAHELEQRLTLDAAQLIAYIAAMGDPAPVLTGGLMRIFWLGFELGKAED